MIFLPVNIASREDGRAPDPAGVARDEISRNPQSWNRYAYVLNNPSKFDGSDGPVRGR